MVACGMRRCNDRCNIVRLLAASSTTSTNSGARHTEADATGEAPSDEPDGAMGEPADVNERKRGGITSSTGQCSARQHTSTPASPRTRTSTKARFRWPSLGSPAGSRTPCRLLNVCSPARGSCGGERGCDKRLGSSDDGRTHVRPGDRRKDDCFWWWVVTALGIVSNTSIDNQIP